jgi:anti-sigma factor RsiW
MNMKTHCPRGAANRACTKGRAAQAGAGPCEKAKGALADYLLRELPQAEAAAVAAHLEGCPACRRRMLLTKLIVLGPASGQPEASEGD